MINFGGRKKKTTFCVRIFDISHCVFTQISIGIARWMQNLIPHPKSTHTAYFWQTPAYFWQTPLPQKQEIPEKCDDDVIITFFQVFLVFGVAGFIKSMSSGYSFFQVFLVFGVARSIKSMPSGYSLDAEFNFVSNKLSRSKFE